MCKLGFDFTFVLTKKTSLFALFGRSRMSNEIICAEDTDDKWEGYASNQALLWWYSHDEAPLSQTGNDFVHHPKSITKMGGEIGTGDSPKQSLLVSKPEAKMVETMQKKAQKGTSMRSSNNVILKFPKLIRA